MQVGQTVHVNKVPHVLLGAFQLNENGAQKEMVILKLSYGTFVSGIYTNKIVVYASALDEYPKGEVK